MIGSKGQSKLESFNSKPSKHSEGVGKRSAFQAAWDATETLENRTPRGGTPPKGGPGRRPALMILPSSRLPIFGVFLPSRYGTTYQIFQASFASRPEMFSLHLEFCPGCGKELYDA